MSGEEEGVALLHPGALTSINGVGGGDKDTSEVAGMTRDACEHKNQLGTINGCYVPCLLNIMGIVLFMRLPWATGGSISHHAKPLPSHPKPPPPPPPSTTTTSLARGAHLRALFVAPSSHICRGWHARRSVAHTTQRDRVCWIGTRVDWGR
jgi:hypothetical protein